MAEHVVEEIFKLRDEVTAGLNRINDTASKLAGNIDRTKKSLSTFPSFNRLLAGFSFYQALSGANKYQESIERIRFITGATTSEASTLALATQRVGVTGDDLTRVFTGLQTHYERLVMSGSKNLAIWNSFGINLKKGPQQTLIDIADAIQKGKIRSTELASVFGVSARTLAKLNPLLNRGTDSLKQQLKSAEQSTAHITAFQRMEVVNMRTAFDGMKSRLIEVASTVETKLAPVFTTLFNDVSSAIDRWMKKLGPFFDYLHDHVASIAKILETMFKVKAISMVANVAGGALGIAGLGRGTNMLSTISRAVAIIGQLAMSLGGLLTLAAGFVIFSNLADIFNNVQGAGTRVTNLMDRIGASFSLLKDVMKPLFDVIDSGIKVITGGTPNLVEGFLKAVADSTEEVTAIIKAYPYLRQQREQGRSINIVDAYEEQLSMIHSQVSRQVSTKQLSDIWDKLEPDKLEAAEQKASKAIQGRGNIIFNNNRFDIRQQFAEGFDPDRIAVAFANDLANLGEMRLQSSQLVGNVI